MTENQVCPTCGLPIGVGSITNMKATGLISFNARMSAKVSHDDDTQAYCLGHVAVEYVPGAIETPQAFQDAFSDGELEV